MFSGSVDAIDTSTSVAEQLAAPAGGVPGEDAVLNNLRIAPRQVALFPNGFKDEAPG